MSATVKNRFIGDLIFMNIIFRTLFIYITIIILILSFSYNYISGEIKQLKILDSQLSGVKYLKDLNLLTRLLA